MDELESIRVSIRRAETLARALDSQFQIPGTSFRFGLDPIISLLPVIGDTIAAALGAFIIREAIRHQVGGGVILRMVLNIIIDWLVGLVPLIGVIPDALYKANAKNARLLRDALQRRLERLEGGVIG